MARSEFGGGIEDVVYQISGGNFQPAAATNVTFFSAQTGGSQYTDLVEVDGVTPISGGIVVTDSEGEIRRFQGPDSITVMWASASTLTERRRMLAGTPGSGATDHGALTGLSDDDHTQYALANGTRGSFAATSHTHAAADVSSGTLGTARLGSGTADNTKYLRGDQTWQTLTAALATVASTGAYADLSGAPAVYTETEIDTLLQAVPARVYYAAGWPGSRPVSTTRPVEFVGPDAQKDTVPGWTQNNIDTYLGT